MKYITWAFGHTQSKAREALQRNVHLDIVYHYSCITTKNIMGINQLYMNYGGR